MLNGRNFVKNDFTCVRPQGRSVVDYCLISHDSLALYTNFYVKRSTELVSEVGFQNLLGTPDHSLLVWDITLDMEYHESKRPVRNTIFEAETEAVRYKTDKIPEEKETQYCRSNICVN